MISERKPSNAKTLPVVSENQGGKLQLEQLGWSFLKMQCFQEEAPTPALPRRVFLQRKPQHGHVALLFFSFCHLFNFPYTSSILERVSVLMCILVCLILLVKNALFLPDICKDYQEPLGE